ncbi:MAG: homoserine O-succinyltransferase [Hyphomicrobiales bacterium]
MPIVLGASQSADSVLTEAGFAASARKRTDRARSTRFIEIGLINNMPDAALKSTERQFVEVLSAAAGNFSVRLHLFSLPEVPRSETGRSHLQAAYSQIGELGKAKLDALIVTGAEPRTPVLDQEPYWDALAEVIDWAEHNTTSTIWSCLAAHAAVLHLDGVQRHELDEKRFGVFACDSVSDDPILSGAPSPQLVPHSRCNELREDALVAHGYRVITRSPEAGVDMFVKQWRSLFVFFQGHPEYHLDSLSREYRRDMGRFLRGEGESCPSIPQGYFDPRSEALLQAFSARAQIDRHADLLTNFPGHLRVRPILIDSWRMSAISVFRNWLSCLAERKA